MGQRALGVTVEARTDELTAANAGQLLSGSVLVVDTFDNSIGRQAVKDTCEQAHIPCLHVGVAGDDAEVIWNEIYRVPSSGRDDICDYPLARNLVTLAVPVAYEAIIGFLAHGERRSYTVTLGGFAIHPFTA